MGKTNWAKQILAINNNIYQIGQSKTINYSVEDAFLMGTITSYYNSKITYLPAYAFYAQSNLQSVDLSACSSIGASAFLGCGSLTYANIPNCTTLGYGTFSSCSKLSMFNFSGSVVPAFCFCHCLSLASFTGPNVTTISASAFFNCGIQAISLSNCTEVSDYAFDYCYSLSALSLPNCKKIGRAAFASCITLSDISSLSQCSDIGSQAFQSCSMLQEAILPNLTAVKGSTFQNCFALSIVSLASNFAYIYTSAFTSCAALTRVINIETVKEIGSYAFMGCNKIFASECLNLPQCSFIGINAMCISSGLYGIKLPNIWNINSQAFFNCRSLTYIDIGNSTSTRRINIGSSAFYTWAPSDITTVVVLRTSVPPSLWNNFKSTFKAYGNYSNYSIYIPSSAMSAYLASAHWSPVSSLFHPLEELSINI